MKRISILLVLLLAVAGFAAQKTVTPTNVPGLGIVTISDIEVTTTFGKMTFLQIPTLYNSSGYATIKSDSISGGRIAVFRLRGN